MLSFLEVYLNEIRKVDITYGFHKDAKTKRAPKS